jgi:hypothetical protein
MRDDVLEIFRPITEAEAAIRVRNVFPDLYNCARVASLAVAKGDLPRQEAVVQLEEKLYRRKASRRLESYTAKVEMDDLLAAGLNRLEGASVRVQAQCRAIEQVENH